MAFYASIPSCRFVLWHTLTCQNGVVIVLINQSSLPKMLQSAFSRVNLKCETFPWGACAHTPLHCIPALILMTFICIWRVNIQLQILAFIDVDPFAQIFEDLGLSLAWKYSKQCRWPYKLRTNQRSFLRICQISLCLRIFNRTSNEDL